MRCTSCSTGWGRQHRYPGEAARFEQRVEGLLAAFRELRLPDSITDRFHIMGGECNYLLRVPPPPTQLTALNHP